MACKDCKYARLAVGDKESKEYIGCGYYFNNPEELKRDFYSGSLKAKETFSGWAYNKRRVYPFYLEQDSNILGYGSMINNFPILRIDGYCKNFSRYENV